MYVSTQRLALPTWLPPGLQVQIMTVSLALSDYQLEPALFLHYRSVGWLGMGPGVMVRPSLEAFTKHLTATGGVMLQVRLASWGLARISMLCLKDTEEGPSELLLTKGISIACAVYRSLGP
jgi:hypothetical protein